MLAIAFQSLVSAMYCIVEWKFEQTPLTASLTPFNSDIGFGFLYFSQNLIDILKNASVGIVCPQFQFPSIQRPLK